MPDDTPLIVATLQNMHVTLKEFCKKLSAIYLEITDENRNKLKKLDFPIAKSITIDIDDEWVSEAINNPEFNRAKIFLNAGFTPSHSAGLSVTLMYQYHSIAKILDVISSNGSTGAVSNTIDIAQLSGFRFKIKNRDTGQSTTVTDFKIVMYKENV